jgi:hypothetical protein
MNTKTSEHKNTQRAIMTKINVREVAEKFLRKSFGYVYMLGARNNKVEG